MSAFSNQLSAVSLFAQPKRPILCIPAPLYPFSPQTRLGVTSRSGALRPNKLIYCTSIRQREHKKCCQLCFEARLTSVASLLGVLTQPFYLLSKPNSPLHSDPKSRMGLQRYCFFLEYTNKSAFFLFFSIAGLSLHVGSFGGGLRYRWGRWGRVHRVLRHQCVPAVFPCLS